MPLQKKRARGGSDVGVSSVCTYLGLFASAATLFVLYSGLKGLTLVTFKVTPFLNIIFFIFKVFLETFSDYYCPKCSLDEEATITYLYDF